jgi:hypothetical protein
MFGRQEIEYRGKMSDSFPAWAFQMATRYALNPIEYSKVENYLKENFGRKKAKVTYAEIIQMSPYGVCETMVVISSCVEIGGKHFHILQALTMYISSSVSSVSKHDYVFGDYDGNVIFEVA